MLSQRRGHKAKDSVKKKEVFRPRDQETSLNEDEKHKSLASSLPILPSARHTKETRSMFWLVFIFSQFLGGICVGLVWYFGMLYGGYAWDSDAELQFNYHPALMITGFVFFYGEAILIYRTVPFLPKLILKIIHTLLHLAAIICASIGITAVFENHRKTNRADLYSFHSWIGLATFVLFCFQFTGSFICFLFPGLPGSWRSRILPFHTFFGIGLFITAIAVSHMGLTERLIWTSNYTKGVISTQSGVGHGLGIAILIFGFLTVFMLTSGKYKRRLLPNEVPQSSRSSSKTS